MKKKLPPFMMKDEEKDMKTKSKAKPAPKAFAKGGSVGGASRRADGVAKKGKTKGKMC